MNYKLIKLSDTHYIVVDNSEIKEEDANNYFYHNNEGIVYINYIKNQSCLCNEKMFNFFKNSLCKITHSTQPLESSIKSDKPNNPNEFVLIKPLSLSEVEEVVDGYSVQKMAMDYASTLYDGRIREQITKFNGAKFDYIVGFKAHQELTKDKLFTIEDMLTAFQTGYNSGAELDKYAPKCGSDFIKTILPKTEWDIEFIDGKICLI